MAALCVGLVPTPAAASGTSTTSPYATSFPTCSGGSVYLTGVVHIVERETESEFTYTYRLTGSNEATGERYRLNATIIDTFAGSPDSDTFTHTFVRKVTLVGLGGAESASGMALVHVTAVDGVVTASLERIDPLC
jgi:hypothetical protein